MQVSLSVSQSVRKRFFFFIAVSMQQLLVDTGLSLFSFELIKNTCIKYFEDFK